MTTLGPRTEALENNIKAYLQRFQKEYNNFKEMVEGEARRRRMKEELRNYTNDERSDEIKKLAIQVWNELVKEDMSFGSKKEFVPIKQTEEITKVVVESIDPTIGGVAPVHSKKFHSIITEAIADFGSGIKDVLGSPIKGLTLPAQSPAYKAEVYNPNENKELIDRLGDRYTQIKGVKTKQSELSTFQLDFSDPSTPPKDKKYIIHFNGNATFANQTLPELAVEGFEHECVVINFDYPGVGESTGKSYRSKHMVDAGVAQVKRLLDMGVPAENILLKGQSIGSGVATLTAAKMHEKGQKVSLYNQRSFSKLSDVPGKAIGRALGKPVGKFVSFVIKRLGWEMNAIKAWNKIPEQYKEYCYGKYDDVIPPQESGLAQAIAKQRAKETDKQKVEAEKEKDKERELYVGHNDQIYNFDYEGEIMQHGVTNVKGEPANNHFDDFARKRFAKLEVTLDTSQKLQINKVNEDMAKALSASVPKEHKVLFGFKKGNNNEVKKIQDILKEIKVKGKITNHQLDVLQHFCDTQQKKTKNNLPEHVKKLNEMLKPMHSSMGIKHHEVLESKSRERAKLRG